MYALYQVLHVQPVEQASVLVGRVVVKIVQVRWEVDRQLAYGAAVLCSAGVGIAPKST